MNVFFGPQGDDGWWEVKRAVPSASRFDEIITPSKGELSKSADGYIAELVAESFVQGPNYFTVTGHPINTYAMQQGKDVEPEARRWVAMDAGMDVTEVRFCMNDEMTLGCSPDGCIALSWVDAVALSWVDAVAGQHNGHDYYKGQLAATLELKVPLLKTHSAYLMKGVLPVEYKPQVHGHMVVTGAQYVEFVSYARAMPPLRVKVCRDEYTDRVEAATRSFVEQYQAALEKVRRR